MTDRQHNLLTVWLRLNETISFYEVSEKEYELYGNNLHYELMKIRTKLLDIIKKARIEVSL